MGSEFQIRSHPFLVAAGKRVRNLSGLLRAFPIFGQGALQLFCREVEAVEAPAETWVAKVSAGASTWADE